jgi:peptide/nickel transport system permease protein
MSGLITTKESLHDWSRLKHWAKIVGDNKITTVGLSFVLFFVLLGTFAPIIATHNPVVSEPASQLLPPSFQHFFGTDSGGRDVFSRVIFAARVDLLIAILAAISGMLIGTLLGAIIGYYGGIVDELGMRVVDGIQAFPVFILAMGVVAALGQSIPNLIIVIGFVQMAPYIRLVRGEVLTIREREFIEAAQCVGLSNTNILFRHVLPNCLAPVFVQVSASTSYAILAIAGLSFIGLGINPPTPEWGSMISSATDTIITGEWWVTLFPGLAIIFSVMGFNLIGDGLQDIIDPQRTLR